MTLSNCIILFSPYDWLFPFYSYPPSRPGIRNNQSVPTWNSVKRKCFIVLLLLLSGNGPDIHGLSTAHDCKASSGLGIIHVRSLLPKLDVVKIWGKSCDILVFSETWLNTSITDKDIAIKSYKVFHCDRLKKGGGVAIYVKNKFNATILSPSSLSRQFEFKGHFITLVGCYRPSLSKR